MDMRIVVTLLSVLMLSACARTAPKVLPTTPKIAAPACFAPAGTYTAFARIRRHDCKTPPRPVIWGLTESVAPNSLKCGLYRTVENLDGHPAVMLFAVAPNGMAGSMTVFLQGCRANYKVVFPRSQQH